MVGAPVVGAFSIQTSFHIFPAGVYFWDGGRREAKGETTADASLT